MPVARIPKKRKFTRRSRVLLPGVFCLLGLLVTSSLLGPLETTSRLTYASFSVQDSHNALLNAGSNADPILWPQTDDRVRLAIQTGERIGPSLTTTTGGETYVYNGSVYESPPPHLATVVSAFYDLSDGRARSGKHQVSEYMKWMQNFLASTDPLVIFCEPGSVWHSLIRTHRQHAPTIIAALPLENLTVATNFDPNFWQQAAIQRDPQPYLRYVKARDPRLYQIWNEKIIMVHETAVSNPFGTEHFVWLDAGYYRDTPVNGTIVRNNMTANGLRPNQMILHNVEDCPVVGYLIAGGAWGGSGSAVRLFYQRYWETFWFMVTHKISCVGVDQYVFVHLCKSFPDLCSLHVSKEWFRLGKVWLRDPQYNFSSTTVLDPQCEVLPGSNRGKRMDPEQMVLVTHNGGAVQLPLQFPIRSVKG